MNTIAPLYTDRRDQVLLGETPTLMQPRFGSLPPPELHKHRFIVGDDGLYIEVRSPVLECRLLQSPSPTPLPYGKVSVGFSLVNGPIPVTLYDRIKELARKECPNEWAGLIVWSLSRQCYELFMPRVYERSPVNVSYERALPDDLLLVVDLHSHGAGDAYFSATDDLSEDGIYIAEVLGRCGGATPTIASRFVINGIPVSFS